MSDVKQEVLVASRKCGGRGGRPTSEGWGLFNFIKVEGDRGKSFGKCGQCHVVLKNTSVQRMRNHRRRCGNGSAQGPSSEIQKLIQTKIDIDEVEQQEPEEVREEVLWSSQNVDDFVDESIPVEKVKQTAMEIIDSDIRRHRKSSKSKVRASIKSLDASLSSFLIGCSLPFDIVDSPHFKKFANQLNSEYAVPSSSQLKARVIQQLNVTEAPAKRRRNYESSDSDTE